MTNFPSPQSRNKPNRGVLFLDKYRPNVFGKVNLGKSDLNLRGIIEVENSTMLIRGEVRDAYSTFELRLSQTHQNGSAPQWVGILENRNGSAHAEKFRVAGFLSQSKETGTMFLKLALYPQHTQNREQLSFLESWAMPPAREISKSRSFSL
jgi:hypothetical protein